MWVLFGLVRMGQQANNNYTVYIIEKIIAELEIEYMLPNFISLINKKVMFVFTVRAWRPGEPGHALPAGVWSSPQSSDCTELK